MTRWHKASCNTPDVIVDGETPICRACNSSPRLHDIIAQQESANAPLALPPDELVGQMKLCWPPSIRYYHDSNAGGDQTEPKGPAGTSVTRLSLLPYIYEALRPDEFRLLCLSSAKNENYPVHATLETYQHDDCPEYETVSYTWGGEDANNTPCKPIYVGPYWDVLLQTKNCWSMLQYLRPLRGLRMVWVDAICIDQTNLAERGFQVAKMGIIYQHCMRVVVYLGDDIVKRPSSKRHPSRHWLHEIDEKVQDPQINLQSLLCRRYFSRVWVIQELILSPYAVIPVEDMEFSAGILALKKLNSSRPLWRWDSTEASWMQNIGHGSSLQRFDLYSALKQTWNSKATDPRDRIFGILGLIQDGLTSTELKPDYSISFLSAFIGAFAHIIINLRYVTAFTIASGLRASPSYPSWVPDWRSLKDWPDELVAREDDLQTLRKRYTEVGSPDRSQYPGLIFSVSKCRSLWQRFDQDDEKDLQGISASIEASTAALSIELTHLLGVTSKPIRKCWETYLSIFELPTTSCALYICTPHVGLDTVISPGSDHLFMLEKPDKGGCILFVLRETGTPNSYKLVLCCSCFELVLMCTKLPVGARDLSKWDHSIRFNSDGQLYLAWPPQSLHSLLCEIQDTCGSSFELLSPEAFEPRSPMSDHRDKSRLRQMLRKLQSIFPFPYFRTGDILPTLQGIINDRHASGPGFAESYIKVFDDAFERFFFPPVIIGMRHNLPPRERKGPISLENVGYLHVETHNAYEITSIHFFNNPVSDGPDWKWRWKYSQEWYRLKDNPIPELRGRLELRIRWEDLRNAVMDTDLYRCFDRLSRFKQKKGAISFWEQPTPEDKLIFLDNEWPQEAMDELGIDGSTRPVQIL